MAVVVESTPNPRAMKFTVGSPVGGPATYVDVESADETGAPLLELTGVQSVFMTGDFVTVTRAEETPWDSIVDDIVTILASAFG